MQKRVQGTLEMLILKTLVLQPVHGYGMALRIEQITENVKAPLAISSALK